VLALAGGSLLVGVGLLDALVDLAGGRLVAGDSSHPATHLGSLPHTANCDSAIRPAELRPAPTAHGHYRSFRMFTTAIGLDTCRQPPCHDGPSGRKCLASS
jgi:hypothetical protein